MADDPNKRGKADRSKVAGMQDHEAAYLAQKMGVTSADVRAAVKRVGNDRAKVEAELKKKK